MIATIAMIAAIAERKRKFSDRRVIVAIIWKPGLSYASLPIKYVSITIILGKREGCIMLFTYSCFFFFIFFLQERKRSFELCKRENKACGLTILGTTSKHLKPFKHLKPQFIGRILPKLSPYLNINYCFIGRALKIYDILYTPWSR